MRKPLLIAVCFLFLIGIAYSAVVEVGIIETLRGNISSLNYDVSSNVAKFSIEFYNTGSVPYKARIKTEIFNNSNMVFSGWGREIDLMSGEKKISDIYWYANNIGDYFAKLKVYFGNDIKEYKKFGFSVRNFVEAEDVFEIKNLRSYDNYIVFDVYSRKNVENVIAIPSNYITGWIFEQEKIGNISENSSKFVLVNYYPTIWKPSNVSLSIVSDNGKYFTEETVEIRKEEGLVGLIYYILDTMRIAFFE